MSNQVYSNDDSQYSVETEFVGAKVIQAAYINGQSGTFNSMVINDLQQDNTLDKVVVWDFDTSELKYSTSIGATGSQGPTGAMGPQGPNGATGSQGPTGATGISVKTSGYLELPSGITVTLTNPMPNFINITAGGAGFNINLPQMNLPDSLQSSPIGTFYIYKNHAGSQITIVNDFAGSPIVTLYPGKIYIFEVASNATPQGSFVFKELTDVVSATSPLSLNATTGELSINLSNYVDLTTNQTIGGIKTFTLSPIFNGPTNQTFPTYIPVGIHNTNKDLQAITNMASTDTSQTFINKTISYASNIITNLPISSSGYSAYYVLNNTSISNVVDTIVPYDTAIATDSGISNSSGTFTINTAGVYNIVATIGYLLSGAGFRRSYIMYNSSGFQYGQNRIIGSASIDGFMVSSFTAKLNVGDTIKVMTLQSSGGNLTLIGYNGFAGTSMTMVQFTRIS